MADEPKGKVTEALEAVKGVLEAAPIYPDAMQPAAKSFGEASQPAGKEIGQAVTLIAKTIHTALKPLGLLTWGWDKIEEYVCAEAERRFKDKPERVVTPNPAVAVPVLESLRYTASEPTLRDMYMNLLETAMDRDTADRAHPAFVEIVRQLTPPEVRILNHFGTLPRHLHDPEIEVYKASEYRAVCYIVAKASGISDSNLAVSWVDNLCRLGLLKSNDHIGTVSFDYGTKPGHTDLFLTHFGRRFCAACGPQV